VATHLSKIQHFFNAYASKNVAGVRSVMADDIVWRIPGHHPLAGEKRGVDEVVVEQGDYVIDHHRGWSDAGSRLDLTWCLVFRFEDGKIKEVTNYCEDQHKADLFFYEIYRLAPIPARLAQVQ
jgi:ketosteroid isomerase-like protein